ncbi:hypothetical protein Aperf_G00000023337 [Anoplocephala perfoliata]
MNSTVKISPSAFQAIALHYSINIEKEIKGILLGSISKEDVFVITAIPLTSNANSTLTTIQGKCKDLSRTANISLQVVGWYHSHNELGLNLSEEDIEFHAKFQSEFPNSIAFLALFGRNAEDFKVKTTSFAAFRCKLNGGLSQLQCLIRPLLPSPFARQYYEASSIAFDEVFQAVGEHLGTLSPSNARKLDEGFLQPYMMSVETMIKSMQNLWPKPNNTDELKDGTMVGEDYLGNKYFENNRYFLGRNRWVIYGNRFGWDYEASQIPPEWHRWLHYMTDETPISHPPNRQPWMKDHEENPTLEEAKKYIPYSTTKPKIEAWQPK